LLDFEQIPMFVHEWGAKWQCAINFLRGGDYDPIERNCSEKKRRIILGLGSSQVRLA
jgi:hypothetical protein